jgi:peroxiredoxin
MKTFLMIVLAAAASAADSEGVRASLQPASERKPAPVFALKDSAGKTVTPRKYRGKVLVLDFWATWCHGCKQEIPWFVEMQKTYGKEGLAVVGVSLDEGGWKVLRPFLAGAKIPYRIVLGDDGTAMLYSIDTMPDTFLIDRKGRLAASYRGGLVDKENLDANIQALLASH